MSKIEDFPILKNDVILRVCKGLTVPYAPVWIMRQAGRYLPEFQAVRKEHEFFEICRTPELVCEVTLQPIRRFNLDAAIIFSDILVIPQIFESHAGVLSSHLFNVFVLPHLRQIYTCVRSRLQNLHGFSADECPPIIMFALGGYYALEEIASVGFEVIGLDWTTDPKWARQVIGPSITLQGNLDPCALYSAEDELEDRVKEMLHSFAFKTRRYIANLGHGICPDVEPEKVAAFVDLVHRYSADGIAA